MEGAGVGTPGCGVGVQHGHGHLHDHILFEQVLVVKRDVFADKAGAGAESVDAQEFLEGRVQQGAVFTHC